MLEIIQEYLSSQLALFLPEPHGSLLMGILLGLQEKLPKDFYNALIRTGTIHVVAASGFNTTIIAKVLLELFSRVLSKKLAIFCSFIGIVSFVFISGANPAVVRAAIMSFLAFLALFFGREYLASWSLILTSLVMILISPEVISSFSFWLSITATGGILWLTSDVQAGMSRFEKSLIKTGFTDTSRDVELSSQSITKRVLRSIWRTLKADFETTMAAQIATLPISIVYFGHISLVSPLVNAGLLWLIPPIMLLGSFKLFSGIVLYEFGYLWSLLVFLPLELFIRLIQLANQLPYASIELPVVSPKYQLIVVVCIYLIYLVIFLAMKNKQVNKQNDYNRED